MNAPGTLDREEVIVELKALLADEDARIKEYERIARECDLNGDERGSRRCEDLVRTHTAMIRGIHRAADGVGLTFLELTEVTNR